MQPLLASKLRLATQSRIAPRTAGRAHDAHRPSAYDTMGFDKEFFEDGWTTLAAMSAGIAHEIRQPLGAIVTNAKAGLRWLNRAAPDLDEVRNALEHIAADGDRASEIIQSIRSMFWKTDHEGIMLDPNRESHSRNDHDRKRGAGSRKNRCSVRIGCAPSIDSRAPEVNFSRSS